MKIIIVSILIILIVSCSEEENQLNHMNANKDMPTPKSDSSTTNPKEDLAPQTCYYGCKARK